MAVLLALGPDASAEDFDPLGPRPPRVTKDDAGNWVAVWSTHNFRDKSGTDADILVTRSSDYGATWTAPAPLNTNAAYDSGVDLFPQVVTDKAGNWLAAWNSNDSLGGTIGSNRKIFVARSTDNGATWTAPAPLNTNPATDSCVDGAPEVVTDNAGNWLAVWHCYGSRGGTIGDDGDILVARSTNNGATWTNPAPLNTNAATDSAEDLYPRVTNDGAGNWVAVWKSSEMDSEDSLGRPAASPLEDLNARSTDNGATWTAPAKDGAASSKTRSK